jgi:hypothetical protein
MDFQSTPRVPHGGGVWERLIRTVRRVLFAVIPAGRISDECLRTIFCEVESIVNSRPLTKVSDDVNDASAISPNQLLYLNDASHFPECAQQADVYRNGWKCVQHIASEFWRQWLRQYLPELNRRNKWQDRAKSIKLGDVVLVMDECLPRCVWPLALVIGTKTSDDGLIRQVTLRLKNGSTMSRPITKLVNLECV